MNKRIDKKLDKWNDAARLHLALTIAVMLFIFIQSAMPGHVSSAESNFL